MRHSKRLRWFPGILIALSAMGCGGSVSQTSSGGHPVAPVYAMGQAAPGFNVHEVTTGRTHSCALTMDGRVACWGDNRGGMLGGASDEERSLPVWVQELGYALDVDAGSSQTCAQVSGGRAVCWGADQPGAVELTGARATIRQLAVGQQVCALDYRGEAYCWLGGVGEEPESLPLSDAGHLLDAGVERTCVLTSPERAECYRYGDLGAPMPVALRAATQLAVSGDHACVTGQGDVYCWGANEHGQLGDGSREARSEPVRISLPERATHVTTGWRHSCATTAPGSVFCWGDNERGQLGQAESAGSASPVRVDGFDAPVIRVAAGMGHTCAVQADRKVYCWGQNDRGQVGVEGAEDQRTPVRVLGPTTAHP